MIETKLARDDKGELVARKVDTSLGPSPELLARFPVLRVHSAADLEWALAESLNLQSHYAELLNMQDGGRRMTFAGVDAWIDRLKSLRRTGESK